MLDEPVSDRYLSRELDLRALKTSLWLALLHSQRLQLPTFENAVGILHAMATQMYDRLDADNWRERLDAEGCKQPPSDER